MQSFRRLDALLLAATLAVSIVSFLFFSFPWFALTIQGRVARGYVGAALFVLLSSVPFAWPYLVAGYFYRRWHDLRAALGWAGVVAVAGCLLHALLVRAEFSAAATASSYVFFYTRHLVPLVFAGVDCLLGHALGGLHARSA